MWVWKIMWFFNVMIWFNVTKLDGGKHGEKGGYKSFVPAGKCRLYSFGRKVCIEYTKDINGLFIKFVKDDIRVFIHNFIPYIIVCK